MAKPPDCLQLGNVKSGKTVLSVLLLLLLALALANAIYVLRAPNEHQYDPHIANVVRQYPIDPHTIRAVIWRESNFNPGVLGKAQERGLMQVTPTAGREWAKSAKEEDFHEDDLYDPYTNIKAGTWYLQRGLRRYADREDPLAFALAEYNAGRSNVLRWTDPENPLSREAFLANIDYPTTKRYILTIEARAERYREDSKLPLWRQWLNRFIKH